MSLFRPVERRGVIITGSPTYNPFNNPSLPLAAVGLDGIFSTQNNDSGELVTVDRAMTVPTVYRCISVISTIVAQSPLNVYKRPDQRLIPVPLLSVENTETTYTPYELWQLAMGHRAAWGNAYVYKVRDNYGKIFDLKPIYPDLVEVKLDKETGQKVFLVKRIDDDGNPTGKVTPLTTWEVMHIPGLGFDGLVGYSPIQLAAQSLGISLAGDRLAARFYSSGSQLGGIIKVKAPLKSQAQAEGIKNRWQMSHGSVSNAGTVAVLDAETDFQPVTIPPDQLQFLESRRWGTTEIARLFGIPPHIVGDVEKSTSWGTGIEQQNIGMVAYTIADYTTPTEQRVTREIVQTRGQYAKFDLSSLMRGSTPERFEAYHTAATSGWVTGNEIRAWEDMPPIDGLDKPFISPNLVPMGQQFPQAPGQPGDDSN